MQRKGNPHTLANQYSHYGEQHGDSLKKLDIKLPYDSAIPLLGIHTEETADEWIRKQWQYIYTMDYYSAIKKNAFESVLMRWMKLEPIIQSEVNQKEKHQYSTLTHVYQIQKDGHQHIYMEFRKMVTMTLYPRQQKRHRYKEQTFGLSARR